MIKSPMDYLLFAARTFLVSAFLANLTIAAVGYCVLPDQIVSYASPNREIGLRNPYSKEFFLGFMTLLMIILFFAGILSPFLPFRERKSTDPANYWDRDESIALKWKITDFWMISCLASFIFFWAIVLLRHFSVNLASPPCGMAWDPLFDTFIIFAAIPSMNWLFCPVTLAVVKWFRERNRSINTSQEDKHAENNSRNGAGTPA